jgi:hypothetical protein
VLRPVEVVSKPEVVPVVCCVEPRAYLREATRRAIHNAGTVTSPRDLE